MRDWHRELAAVARERFVPDTIWLDTGTGYAPLRRPDDPVAWRRHVAANEPIVIQVDDGQTAPGAFGRAPSSSTSQPSVVALMLAAADLRRGRRILEIGTGTGWNTALLCEKLGDAAVFSVEIDPLVAEAAATALAGNGYHPTLVVGDGALGHPDAAPYDRVLATVAAIGPVPYPWVAQTRPGGMVITPWGTEFCNGALLRLRVNEDGIGVGHFHQAVAFIRLRGQRRAREVPEEDGIESATSLPERKIHEAISIRGGAFAIGLRVPDCGVHIVNHVLAEGIAHCVHLNDPASGSWARVDVGPVWPFPVFQAGPRRLWDEVEAAYAWWRRRSRPQASRFGLTVTPTGQSVWLDNPTTGVLDQ
ncbi:MAG TPA: methyltransferase domain-containing protein [Pseudonocardiaceae bacterium]|nr:methyltransferase domain-containing protein [Pseudonocardiaceae bacterium]